MASRRSETVRIAVVNWSRRKAGGAEYYLSNLIPALAEVGHTIALLHETDQPTARAPIVPDGQIPIWGVGAMGATRAIAELRQWMPDVIYCHGLVRPDLESQVLYIAPAVFFAHGYYGTCISGTKSWKIPTVRPCSRRFGWQCFLHFYPHRCGGLSPVTMIREHRRQAVRLKLLERYRAIVTHSRHMQNEYLKHGFPPEGVHRIPFHVTGADSAATEPAQARCGRTDRTVWRLLFIGRMNEMKGGLFLLDALPRVRQLLGRPVHLSLTGDGPERARWENRAARLTARDRDLSITFTGWIERSSLDAVLDVTDLLVVPSVWPEPFGQVGPEAGMREVPVAAFATGGISEWLKDGVNGCLAPGNLPRAAALADAIVKCLHDPATYARLRQGARAVARQFTMAAHIAQLLSIFHDVVESPRGRLDA
jgi:glycosyltransferase involved in cell wall biosynthesis